MRLGRPMFCRHDNERTSLASLHWEPESKETQRGCETYQAQHANPPRTRRGKHAPLAYDKSDDDTYPHFQCRCEGFMWRSASCFGELGHTFVDDSACCGCHGRGRIVIGLAPDTMPNPSDTQYLRGFEGLCSCWSGTTIVGDGLLSGMQRYVQHLQPRQKHEYNLCSLLVAAHWKICFHPSSRRMNPMRQLRPSNLGRTMPDSGRSCIWPCHSSSISHHSSPSSSASRNPRHPGEHPSQRMGTSLSPLNSLHSSLTSAGSRNKYRVARVLSALPISR